MATRIKISDGITNQLDEQGISYEFLTESELSSIASKWNDRFIGDRKAPGLEKYRWHIFSNYETGRFEGEEAKRAYEKQYPSDFFIFNERLQYGVKCSKSSQLPEIKMEGFNDDIYICHHNMKWTFVITHESPEYGPYFSS